MGTETRNDSDVLLDLGEPVRAWVAEEDEFVLDLDDEPVPVAETPMRTFVEPQVTEAAVAASAAASYQPEVHSAFADTQEVPFPVAMPAPEVAVVQPEPMFAEPEPVATSTTFSADQLSPEMIDAIARRVVEMMSDKVVREIAWEVVPDLAELLIKQQLEKTK